MCISHIWTRGKSLLFTCVTDEELLPVMYRDIIGTLDEWVLANAVFVALGKIVVVMTK